MVEATAEIPPTMTTGRAAPRRRAARFWVDPRFLVGVLLIVVSVAATVFVVSAAGARAPLLAARHTLVPGDTAHLDDFIVTRVDLPGADGAYLAPDAMPAEGAVVTRTIGEGELVPTAALGSAASVELRSVVLEAAGPLASGVVTGASVDVWSAAKLEDGGFAPPTVLVPAATVASVDEGSGIVVSGGASVELLVPEDTVAAVLGAISNDAAISIVAASGSLGS